MPSSPQTPPWYVITGGPSAGKTTVIDLLAQHGYATTIEEARHYINLEAHLGINSTQARLDACAFQQNILKLQIELCHINMEGVEDRWHRIRWWVI